MISLPKQFKAIIFDLDGTLADTMPIHYRACQIVCQEYGFDFPKDYFYQEAGKPTLEVFQNLVKMLGKNLDGNTLGRAKEEKFLELIHTVQPISLVADVARNYKGKVPMAIGSGGQRNSVDLTLKAIGFDQFFDCVVTCDDVVEHKPHPATFLKAAYDMGVSAIDCLVFEDGDPGIQAAKSAGMMVVDIREYF